MKDEIKEINIPENVLVALGDLTNGALNYYKATETVKVKYSTILDYITNLKEEKERLKNGYCELKVKCNNGECDCTNEEYDGMVQCNMKLSLENDELRNILEKMGTNPNEILYLKNEVDELNNIIDELNNIIDELENFIETYAIPEFNLSEEPTRYFMETKIILDKLKELKEGKENDK